MNRPSRWIAGAAAAGLLLRLAFALFYWTGQPLTLDERQYLALGRSLAAGRGFVYPADEPAPGTGQQVGRAPGYPLFLALLHVTEPATEVPRRVKLAQCVVSAAGIWILAGIARRAAGDRAGIAAAWVAAVYPPLIFMPAYALSETVYSTIALSAAYALHARTASATAAGGAATGLAMLVRPAMLLFAPLAALWLLARRRAADAALFTAVVAIVCVPWLIHNQRAFGRFSLASEGGVTFWTGNNPRASGDGDMAANPALKQADVAFRAAHPGLSPDALEPLYYADALAWIRAHPAAWLRLEGRKAFYSVVPIGPSYALHSSRYFAASALSYALALAAAGFGYWRWRRLARRGTGPEALWLMAASTLAAGLVFFPQERFRLPVIDPALIVTAALGVAVRADDPPTDERIDRRPNV